VAYGQKAGYFDLGKKGTAGAELAVASSWDISLADVNDQLTRQGARPAGYNALTTAASGAHTTSSTCVPGTGVGTGCTYVANAGVNDSVETNWDLSVASGIANDNHFGVYLTQTPTPAAFTVLYQYLADRAATIRVVTHSWGSCVSAQDPTVVLAAENAFAQAAAGGQAWFIATGDTGSNAATAPAGSTRRGLSGRFFLRDGGRRLRAEPQRGRHLRRERLGGRLSSEREAGAARAGAARPRTAYWVRVPSWQSGTGVTGTYRLLPDISMHYGTCTTPAREGVPRQAGREPAGDERHLRGRAPVGRVLGGRQPGRGTNLGFAAPVLVRILRNEGGTSYAACFHDVTTGSNGAYSAGVGFDKVTGIGTPKFNALYPALQTLFAPVSTGCFTDTTQADFQAGPATSSNTTASPGT
jgi:kumamolisin